MVISQITITNFRSFTAATFDLGQRTLVLGTNGAGKSTILDAIAWCLTGRCRGVNGKGEGQTDLIRVGADGLTSVQLTTDVLGTIRRTISRDGTAACSMRRDDILARLNVSEPMLLAAIYAGTFFQLHHADAKAMLMQLLDVTVPGDQIELGLTGPVTLDVLDAKYKAAFDERAAVKRALAAIRVPEEPAQVPAVDQARLDQVMAAYQAATKDEAKLDANLAAVDGQITAMKKAAQAIPALEVLVQSHQDMLAEATAGRDETRRQMGEALSDAMLAGEANVEGHKNRALELNTLIEQIGRHEAGRGCVLAAGIPCLTPPAEFTDHVATLRKEVAKLAKLVKAGAARNAEQVKLAGQLADAERQITYHQTQLDKAKGELAAARSKGGDLSQLEDNRADIQKGLDAATIEVKRLGDELRTLQAGLTAATAAQKARAAYDQAVASQARLKADVDRLEALVALLGPNGIRREALATKLGEFETLIGLAMRRFGFQLKFQLDPWAVMATVAQDGRTVPFSYLSAGEQLWCGLAFQVALAMVSGLNFVAVDAAEAVVDIRRALLTEAVMAAPVDQILVAMARATSEPNPDLDGLKVIRLG